MKPELKLVGCPDSQGVNITVTPRRFTLKNSSDAIDGMNISLNSSNPKDTKTIQALLAAGATEAGSPLPTLALVASEGESIDSRIRALGILAEQAEESHWTIGDEVNAIRAETSPAMSYAKIAKIAGCRWTRQRFEQVAKVCAMFHSDLRNTKIEFGTYERGRKASRQLGDMGEEKKANWIAGAINSGAKTPRKIAKIIRDRAAKKQADEAATRATPAVAKLKGIINNLHHAAWADVAAKLEPESIAAVWADPPFAGGFSKVGEVPYSKGKSVLPNKSDNSSPTDAKQTTLELFDILPPLMQPGAPLFLHQHGGLVDDPQIIAYALEQGWRWHTPIVWAYGNPVTGVLEQPGIQTPAPFGSACQRILVATFGDHSFDRVGESPSSNLIIMPPISRKMAKQAAAGTANRYDGHTYMHSPELAEQIVSRCVLRNSGGLILEPFGCSGPMAQASIRCGWNWAYCESNAENFGIGRRCIDKALAEIEVQAG